MPVTMPLEAPITATAGALLTQEPPPASVNVMVALIHTAEGPEIAAGKGLTTIVALPVIVAVQPVVTLVAITV